jgi:drug/metabolite transporter (DMT)-like permease
MFYIFLAICFSVAVSVLLKLAKRYQIDVYQAITWNYSAAILLTWLIFRPHLTHLQDAPIVTYATLGVLLPVLFLIIAASIKITGIVRTDAAQRLSLFIPVLAAFIVFGEKPDAVKFVSLAIGFTALVCLIPWKQRRSVRRRPTFSWIYLVVIFAGMGLIDVLLKQVARTKDIPFTTSLFIVFILAFGVAIIGMIYMIANKKMRFSWPHILIGWILGIANFGNIFFFIKAHQALANRPASVFSTMDIGVIIVGTLIGLFVFREKLTRLNLVGILLGLVAIVINAFPEFFDRLGHLF